MFEWLPTLPRCEDGPGLLDTRYVSGCLGVALLVDGKIYLDDEDGDVVVLQEGKTKKVIAEMKFASSVYSTAVPAHGVLFISTRNQLYALAETQPARP